MTNRLNELLREIRDLERSIEDEMRRREEELRYTVRNGRVRFDLEVADLHRKLSSSTLGYVFRGSLPNLLSAPVIYTLLVPAALLDLFVWLYQAVCFPVYTIPKVRRRDHFVLDRRHLKYLNAVERLNCDYCSYFTGVLSYAAEVAARTEQFWCPIKHASAAAARSSRAQYYTDYGDAAAWRERLEAIRKQYEDLR